MQHLMPEVGSRAPCLGLPTQHALPSNLAVYVGAETGAGGRIRDTHATGIGSIMGVSTAGYCTGNLSMEDYPLPGEDTAAAYPAGLAPPLQVPPSLMLQLTSPRCQCLDHLK